MLSKIIVPRLNAAAFSLCMIGMTSGEMLAVAILPINNSVMTSYLVILGLQIICFFISLFYSFRIAKVDKQRLVQDSVDIQTDAPQVQIRLPERSVVVAHEPTEIPEISENVSVEPSENSKKRKSNFGQKVVVVLKDIKAQTFAFWCLAVSRIIVTAIFKIYDSRSLVSLMSIFGQEESVVRDNIIYQFVTAIGTLLVLAFV